MGRGEQQTGRSRGRAWHPDAPTGPLGDAPPECGRPMPVCVFLHQNQRLVDDKTKYEVRRPCGFC